MLRKILAKSLTILLLLCLVVPPLFPAAAEPQLQWADLVTGVDTNGNPTITRVYGYYANVKQAGQVFVDCDPATGKETGWAYVPGAKVGERQTQKLLEYERGLDPSVTKTLFSPWVTRPLWKGTETMALAAIRETPGLIEYGNVMRVMCPYGDNPAQWPDYWKWIFYPLENRNNWPVVFNTSVYGKGGEGYIGAGETKYYRRVLDNSECRLDNTIYQLVSTEVKENLDPEALSSVGPDGYLNWPAWWGIADYQPLMFTNNYYDGCGYYAFKGLWRLRPCFKKIPKFIPDTSGSSVGSLTFETVPAYRWENSYCDVNYGFLTDYRMGVSHPDISPQIIPGRLVPYEPGLPGPLLLVEAAGYVSKYLGGGDYSDSFGQVGIDAWEAFRNQKWPERIYLHGFPRDPNSAESLALWGDYVKDKNLVDAFFTNSARTELVLAWRGEKDWRGNPSRYVNYEVFEYSHRVFNRLEERGPFEGSWALMSGTLSKDCRIEESRDAFNDLIFNPSALPRSLSGEYSLQISRHFYSPAPMSLWVIGAQGNYGVFGSYSRMLNVVRSQKGTLVSTENEYNVVVYNPSDHPMYVAPCGAGQFWMGYFDNHWEPRNPYGSFTPVAGTVVPPKGYGVIVLRGQHNMTNSSYQGWVFIPPYELKRQSTIDYKQRYGEDGLLRLGHPGQTLVPGVVTPCWADNSWVTGWYDYEPFYVSLEAVVTDDVVGVDTGVGRYWYDGGYSYLSYNGAFKVDGRYLVHEREMAPPELNLFAQARPGAVPWDNVWAVVRNGVCAKKIRTLGRTPYWVYVD